MPVLVEFRFQWGKQIIVTSIINKEIMSEGDKYCEKKRKYSRKIGSVAECVWRREV